MKRNVKDGASIYGPKKNSHSNFFGSCYNLIKLKRVFEVFTAYSVSLDDHFNDLCFM
jgi:hypothetical protein